MWLQVFLAAVFVGFALGEGDGTARRTAQVPFVADAVGNSLPPPANVPAKVGSPSNLLTPDRYEFYTFDESGELVKRLMTLEEIQAIVAAEEGNDGHMVTFAQDEKPTIAFNFSQPPFTKVHSVVTNVQNVLKSQMEAQKKNPINPITFDTPDVSNSWSMILPSIFGNTGVDIVPDKLPSPFGTPETETIDSDTKPNYSDLDSDISALSKEETGENIFESSKDTFTESKESNKEQIESTTTNAFTAKTTTSKPQFVVTATTQKELTTSKTTTKSTQTPITTTAKKSTTTTTIKPIVTTTEKLSPSISTTTKTPTKTTTKSSTKIEHASIKTEEVTNKTNLLLDLEFDIKSSSHKNDSTTIKSQVTTTIKTTTDMNYVKIKNPHESDTVTTKPNDSTTSQLITEKNTVSQQQIISEPIKKVIQQQILVTTYRPSSTTESNSIPFTISYFSENKNENETTSTQSVSTSTAHKTTDVLSATNISSIQSNIEEKIEQATNNATSPQKFEQDQNQDFDVAQSISQIASDLGDDSPSQNNENTYEAQIKENGDIDLPENLSNKTIIKEVVNDNFVKVTTIDPQNIEKLQTNISFKPIITTSTERVEINNINSHNLTTKMELTTQIDQEIYLSESMSDLLSQVVHPPPSSIMKTTEINTVTILSTESPLNRNDDMDIITTTGNSLTKVMVNEDDNKNDFNKTLEEKTTDKTNLVFDTRNSTNTTDFIKLSLVTASEPNISFGELQRNENNFTTNNKITINKGDGAKVSVEKPFLSKTESTQAASNLIKESPNKTSENITKVNHSDILKPVKFIEYSNKTDNQNSNITHVNGLSNNQVNESRITINSSSQHHQNLQQNIFQKVNESKKKIQKVNIDDKEYDQNSKNDSWKLVSTVSPSKSNDISISKPQNIKSPLVHEIANDPSKEINLDVSNENQGLEITTKNLGEDVYQFTELCNELAFRYWSAATENIDKRRSFVLSPYSITSMLAMMFMGARGATSGEMNDILKLDDMVTFNPHFTLKNISDSIETTPASGVAVSAFVRELYSDRNRGKLLTFYKERAQHFYSGHVEEINFKLINDIIRRRTNLLVKRYTWGKINEFIKTNDISMTPPLAAFSANIFETDCTGSSVEGRDGEMYFVVSPSVRQRRLVPVPAVVYRGGFLAGYHPGLDATAAAVGPAGAAVSLVLLMPGQQGSAGRTDDLERLERDLLDAIPTAPHWHGILRTLLPRPALELQIPRFAHRSVFNVSAALRRMGLRELFDPARADLGGLNGPSKDLFLSDAVEASAFATCGEEPVGERHHSEEYPGAAAGGTRRRRRSWEEPRDYQRAFHDPHDVGAALPLHLRPRQARLPAPPAPHPARLKFDRPFLYFVRHNHSGMILYVGRYNPRLLP